MTDESSLYVEYRVMRHRAEKGNEQFAIHEVYFTEDGHVDTYTADALSPREPSVEQLRATLQRLLEQEEEEVATGDLNYTYHKVDIEEMLQCTEHPPLDYEEEPSSDAGEATS